jgi:hypothetical protein
MFQILNEARNAAQHCPISVAPVHPGGGLAGVERCNFAGGGDGKPTLADDERLPAKVGKVEESSQMWLRL